MIREKEYKFNVRQIKSGQPKPYADSEYEYEVESDCPEFTVKQFCTKVLQPCNQTKAEWDVKNANSYFRGYYEFRQIDVNKYRYYVLQPFCD
jgi:hypothetical protein